MVVEWGFHGDFNGDLIVISMVIFEMTSRIIERFLKVDGSPSCHHGSFTKSWSFHELGDALRRGPMDWSLDLGKIIHEFSSATLHIYR